MFRLLQRGNSAMLAALAVGLAAPAARAQTACQPVTSEQVLGRQLAAAIPAFQAMPPDALVATLPPPGSRRMLHAPELAALAKRYNVTIDENLEACFEWPQARLDRKEVTAAMVRSLGMENVQIEIADLIASPVPAGELEFPKDRLSAPAGTEPRAPVLWRGDAVYAPGKRFPVWARVKITVPCERIYATEAIHAGQPLRPSQLRSAAGQCFPSAAASLTIEHIAGLSLKRVVSAGAEIVPDLLSAVKDINRGDAISVQVISGAARLVFTGKAETAGSIGETIVVRNPASNRIFRARISGKGAVLVETDTNSSSLANGSVPGANAAAASAANAASAPGANAPKD